jgi:hypothetical protein
MECYTTQADMRCTQATTPSIIGRTQNRSFSAHDNVELALKVKISGGIVMRRNEN